MALLKWVMQFFGGDPGIPVVRDGEETFPLVPVAVGLYSIGFNFFNTALLFPFVTVFERVLSRIGHDATDDVEDYSLPRFLDPRSTEPATRLPLVQQEMARYVDAAGLFLPIAGGEKPELGQARALHASLDILSREIRRYTAAMFRPDMSARETDLLASVIEEEDFTASLGETLFQIARRVERQPFSDAGKGFVDATLTQVTEAMDTIATTSDHPSAGVRNLEQRQQFLLSTRQRCLDPGSALSWEERGRILELLGSSERAFFLIDRVDAERRSVPRFAIAPRESVLVPTTRLAAEAAGDHG